MFDAGDMLRIVGSCRDAADQHHAGARGAGRLVSEQALEALPNRSVRVPLITRERLDDLARARCLIEGQMVALALPNLTADDFALLKQLNCRLRRGLPAATARTRPCHLRAEPRLPFPHLSGRALAGADPDRREPVAAIRRLSSAPAAHIHDEQGGLAATNHHWALIEALERGDAEGRGARR